MKKHDLVIIGAGPYGLSIAAHLGARGVDFRIFGSPMRTWLTEMPKGMRLKSEGFASSLYDPRSEFTLGQFCNQLGIPYAHQGLPVPLDTFSSYGLEFQKRYVPQLEDKEVVSVQLSSTGFEVRLADGEVVSAGRVVVAVGLSHFGYVPPMLSALPSEFVTHSSRHRNLDRFKGREVAVIGAGASALDLAALLHQGGASVQLIARRSSIRFHDRAPVPRPFRDRLRAPTTGLGSGWKLFFYASAPLAFHKLPEPFRLDAVRRTLGPAPGWFVKDEVVGKVPFNLGVEITQAKLQNAQVALELTDHAGNRRTMVADHVIAATGYKVDLEKLAFLNASTRAAIRTVEQTPVLSSNFESSVPGLYFVGTAAANSFGPLMRFAFGARFTSRRLSKHLTTTTSRKTSWVQPAESVSTEDRGELVYR
jgi:thioredoxin reductase